MIGNRYITNGSDVFEVVDTIPYGYGVWNIPTDGLPDGYLPLAKLKDVQPFKGCMEVESNTLKAIRAKGVKEMIYAKGLTGCKNIYEAKAYMDDFYKNQEALEQSDISDMPYEAKVVSEALAYMRMLKWN